MKRLFAVFVLSGISVQAQTITETFGSGANQFSIEFVQIGNPGNAADTTGFGAVSYSFNMGKYEINRDLIAKANSAVGLGISLFDLTSSGGNGTNRPATGISWYEAAKFVNFLNTSKGYQAAYFFDGSGNFQVWSSARSSGNNFFRHKDAYYFLPSVDEWYKAAYGGPNGVWYNFATGNNSEPPAVSGGTSGAVYGNQSGPADVNNAGGLSPFGTMGQGGNAWEWVESAKDGINNTTDENRLFRGGSWGVTGSISLARGFSFDNAPTIEGADLGFRVAMVPEPSSLSLLLAGGAVLMAGRRRKRD